MINAFVFNDIIYVELDNNEKYDFDTVLKVQDTLNKKYPENKISIITK